MPDAPLAPGLIAPGLIALGLLAALAYLALANRAPSPLRSVLKTAPLLLFAAAMYASRAPALLVAALLLSALGDGALSREGRAAFLYGLAAFALAHLVYVLLFLGLGATALWEAFAIAPLAALVMLALAFSTELWLAPHAGGLRWPVRLYVALITAMGWAALSTGNGLLIAGAVLFILSDFILALRMFRLAPASTLALWAGWGVWLSYIAGQLLIVLALAP